MSPSAGVDSRPAAPGVAVGVSGVDLDLAGRRIVESAVLEATPGQMVGLIGPNGSGKSTLLRAVFRALRPAAGQVVVGADDVWSLHARECARRVAVVHQDDASDFAFSVRQTVELGRVPHVRSFGRPGVDDPAVVDRAMVKGGVEGLADRMLTTLSGGERQRVFVARALAQDTPVLVLDEPTNHLDVQAQLALLELVSSLPATVVAALHDLNLAAAYCDRLFVLARGRVVASGPVRDVLTPELLQRVYGVRAEVTTNPMTGRPHLMFAPAPESDPRNDPNPDPHLLEGRST